MKLLLQTQSSNSRIASQGLYSGPLQCFRRIYQEEGILAFWRGNTANVLRYFPSQAINFALKDKFKYLFAAPAHEAKSVRRHLFQLMRLVSYLLHSFGLNVVAILQLAGQRAVCLRSLGQQQH